MKIFVDGVEEANEVKALSIGDAGKNHYILVALLNFPIGHFNGLIDEIRVWNIARSKVEIQSTIDAQLEADYYTNENSGLVGYWQLNEATGQISSDLAKSDNLILNGSFDDLDDYWNFPKSDNVEAEVIINDHYFIDITNGGITHKRHYSFPIQCISNSGEKYILKFDGWAQGDKFIDVKIRRANSPFTDYTRIGAVYLNQTEQTHSFSFEMTELSDGLAQLIFMVGGDNNDVYLDNVSLNVDVTTNISKSSYLVNSNFLLIIPIHLIHVHK